VEVLERMGSVEVLVRGPPLMERVANLQKSGVGQESGAGNERDLGRRIKRIGCPTLRSSRVL
jgi:hypothetical protein